MSYLDSHSQVTFKTFRPEKKFYYTISPGEHHSSARFQENWLSHERSNSCVSTQCTDNRGSDRENSGGIIVTESINKLNNILLHHQDRVPNVAFSRSLHVSISLNGRSLLSSRESLKKEKQFNCLLIPLLRSRFCRSPFSKVRRKERETQTSFLTNEMSCQMMTVSQVTSFCTALSESFYETTRTNSLQPIDFRSHKSETYDQPEDRDTPPSSYTSDNSDLCDKTVSEMFPSTVSTSKRETSFDYDFSSLCTDEKMERTRNILDKEYTRELSEEKCHCTCEYLTHCQIYDPSLPLHTAANIVQGSYEEALTIAKACCGRWITIIERSDSLDSQYRCLGLNPFKRAIMNRLAVPLTMFLENEDTILHCWIHTPLGIRHMRSNLLGDTSVDEDSDVGVWKGVTKVVDYSIPWFCSGSTVRALQQIRHNESRGTCIETRCVLPDKKEGRVMLFNFSIIPKQCEAGDQLCYTADRILRKQR